MAWGFSTFEKCKEIFEAVRKLSWFAVPVLGPFIFVTWWLIEYLPARALQLLDWLARQIPSVNLNLASVGLDWSRVNQWVPLNEALTFGTIWVTLAGSLLLLKLVKKLLPFS